MSQKDVQAKLAAFARQTNNSFLLYDLVLQGGSYTSYSDINSTFTTDMPVGDTGALFGSTALSGTSAAPTFGDPSAFLSGASKLDSTGYASSKYSSSSSKLDSTGYASGSASDSSTKLGSTGYDDSSSKSTGKDAILKQGSYSATINSKGEITYSKGGKNVTAQEVIKAGCENLVGNANKQAKKMKA